MTIQKTFLIFTSLLIATGMQSSVLAKQAASSAVHAFTVGLALKAA